MHPAQARTTAVIVSFNSHDHIGGALEALLPAHDAGDLDCVVVDNDSSDGTAEFVSANYPWVKLIRSPRNLGFGRACNLGFTLVGTEYVLIQNPDAVVDHSALKTLVGFMQSAGRVGIAAPATVHPDGSLQQAGMMPTPGTLARSALPRQNVWPSARTIVPDDPPFQTSWVCGAVMLIRSAVFRRLGGFDPRFFLYFEETDLCRRAARLDVEIWAVGGAVVRHEVGASSAMTGERIASSCIAEHFYRSRFYYLVKHFGWVRGAGAEVLARLSEYARAVRFRATSRRGVPPADLRRPFLRFPEPVTGTNCEVSAHHEDIKQMKNDRMLVISPCRDEAEYMRTTLDSVVGQTVRPDLWVIVDDGSTDDTPRILDEYAAKYDFIVVLHRTDRGHRSVGPGVVEAFYYGYDRVPAADFEFICKLDLDLDLPPRYFEILLERFRSNPRIGTCSGKPYFLDHRGRLVSEKCGDENSVGMTKLYRTRCFDQIGGLVREVMWDAIDGHRCRMLGWIAVSWDEPDLRFLHLRPMGSSQQGMLTGRMRHGYGQYFMGASFVYMSASALYRMTRPPFLVGGAAMWWGYVKSAISNRKRLEDREFRTFLRRYQLRCLVQGKANATRRENERQACVSHLGFQRDASSGGR